jgi:hypothetical protein
MLAGDNADRQEKWPIGGDPETPRYGLCISFKGENPRNPRRKGDGLCEIKFPS